MRNDQMLMGREGIDPLTEDLQEWLQRFAALGDDALTVAARELRDEGHGGLISYSRKVFIPLTQLCRDVCHYCTFAQSPRAVAAPYLTPEEVLAIARAGERAGCTEALFTLGDKPELRYPQAAAQLAQLGFPSTIAYLAAMCRLVMQHTALLPHANPGVMEADDILLLREVSASQGLMLESSSERLCARGGPHHGSPDKHPARRLRTLALLGECRVPTTTGLLIGIGETWDERIDALLRIRDLHRAHGHIQEVIIQNFRPKPGTRMAGAPEADFAGYRRTIAAARLILGPAMNLQAPPNLSPGRLADLIDAGLNDWGGVSPVTIDHVNPEAPWPHLEALADTCSHAGKTLVMRLPVYPAYARDGERWLAPAVRTGVLQAMDAAGYAREDGWAPGIDTPPAALAPASASTEPGWLREVRRQLAGGDAIDQPTLQRLFTVRGAQYHQVLRLADELRREVAGDTVRFVVNRNINYTNLCTHGCTFCAFSKGRSHEALRGKPYDLSLAEIGRRAAEAWARGATEVCLQGGIHPDYTGDTYVAICEAVKAAAPGIHVHAFSPLEVLHGARTTGSSVRAFLARLRQAGLGTLPGTAAEILDDGVRRILCPDKLDTQQWLDVMRTAHALGLRSTATIMFGAVEGYEHWARHLAAVRSLQHESGGFTEFVPLPFVHMEAPLYRRGLARRGPTFREAVLMHAVARIALHGAIANIQVSWVKMGRAGSAACLAAGANDMGGTLMNESISRAAGAQFGQELPPRQMRQLIEAAARVPRQRDTLYRDVSHDRELAGALAAPLAPLVFDPPRRRRVQAAGVVDG